MKPLRAFHSSRSILNVLNRRYRKTVTGKTQESTTDSKPIKITDRATERATESEPKHQSDDASEKAKKDDIVLYPEPGTDQVLLIFKGCLTGDTGRAISGFQDHVYECHNLPGYPICDADIEGFRQIPVLEGTQELMIAITRLLQREEWKGWYAKCALRSGTRKFDNTLKALAVRIVFARKECTQKHASHSPELQQDNGTAVIPKCGLPCQQSSLNGEKDLSPPPAYTG